MSKPSFMSRKDYRNIKIIAESFISHPAFVDFSDSGAETYHSESHEEGYSSKFVRVSLTEQPGRYLVEVEHWGRDCDGKHSQADSYTVGAAGKRKRYYFNRDYKANRPIGKFGVKSAFKILDKGFSSQRDYTAEASGY